MFGLSQTDQNSIIMCVTDEYTKNKVKSFQWHDIKIQKDEHCGPYNAFGLSKLIRNMVENKKWQMKELEKRIQTCFATLDNDVTILPIANIIDIIAFQSFQ